jgi:signal transduction histidine kinase
MIHVLYAEDDLLLSALVKTCFEHAAGAATVETVTTGKACLDRMAQGGVDVLLLDLELPDTNGLRILSELAVRGDTTPVVMVSGHGQTALAVKALRAGAVDCVDKAAPQFRQIVEIVNRAHHKRVAGGVLPADELSESHRVWLIETSAITHAAIDGFFVSSAPQIELTTISTSEALDYRLGSGVAPDAAILGSTPAGMSRLDLLRKLRSQFADLPVILLASQSDAEEAVAAFKLGARDYIQKRGDYLAQIVFSLSHGLNSTNLARRNAQLSRELAAINRSLEAQVETRTRELQALSMRLLRVQEDERRLVARELHDQIGQMLTGVKFQLEAAAADAAMPLQGKLQEILVQATELLSRTRQLTLQLRPQLLDDLGLKPALEWHLQVFERQTGIAVAGDFSLPEGRLPGELETAIFRVVQEALTNVARHSGANSANLTVAGTGTHIIAEVTDRGRGFDLERVRSTRESVGLAGMAERVQLAGGAVEIVSSPGKGTRVYASFPLPTAGAKAAS